MWEADELPNANVVTTPMVVIAQLVVVSRRCRYVVMRPTSARYRWAKAVAAFGDNACAPTPCEAAGREMSCCSNWAASWSGFPLNLQVLLSE